MLLTELEKANAVAAVEAVISGAALVSDTA